MLARSTILALTLLVPTLARAEPAPPVDQREREPFSVTGYAAVGPAGYSGVSPSFHDEGSTRLNKGLALGLGLRLDWHDWSMDGLLSSSLHDPGGDGHSPSFAAISDTQLRLNRHVSAGRASLYVGGGVGYRWLYDLYGYDRNGAELVGAVGITGARRGRLRLFAELAAAFPLYREPAFSMGGSDLVPTFAIRIGMGLGLGR